jgi:hypothetical protein
MIKCKNIQQKIAVQNLQLKPKEIPINNYQTAGFVNNLIQKKNSVPSNYLLRIKMIRNLLIKILKIYYRAITIVIRIIINKICK